MTTKPDFELYFGEEKVNVVNFSYQINRRGAPIFELGSPDPGSFSTGEKRSVTGTISCYLTKDYLTYHYQTAEVVIPEMILKNKKGVKITSYVFENAHAIMTSNYGDPHENTMLYDITFMCSDLSMSHEFDFSSASNEEIEEHVLRPMDEELIELPLILELRR